MRQIILLAAALSFTGSLFAEDAFLAEAKQAYNQIKTNIMRSAEKMPDDAYSFQATQEERTWGALMGHIADAQTRYCGMASGQQKTPGAGKLTKKEELVAALKESFATCDAAWESTTEANAHDKITMGRMERTRLGLLSANTIHDNESYGTMAVYMRLKGVVPPSSDRPAAGKK